MRESRIEIGRDDEDRESEEVNENGREGGETEMHLGEKSEIGRRLKQRDRKTEHADRGREIYRDRERGKSQEVRQRDGEREMWKSKCV